MTARPLVAAPAAWSFPQAQEFTLSNGAFVCAYNLPGQHVVNVRMLTRIPYLAEPREAEGVAEVYAELLTEGTTGRPGVEFTMAVEREGVGLAAGMSETSLRLNAQATTSRLGAALELLAEALTTPQLDPEQIARLVAARASHIDQERSIAGIVAMQTFAQRFYDESARAARPSGGTKASIEGITPAAVRAWHERAIRAEDAAIVIVGDLDGMDLPALLEATLGALPATGAGEPVPPPGAAPRASTSAGVFLVDRPGSVQSEIIMGCPGPDRSVAGGWAPFPVLGYAIGGSPTARIDDVLREEKGFTYGIRAGFRPRSVGGLFLVSGSVRADATGESVRLLSQILGEVHERPLTQDELRGAVDFLTLTAPGRYDTSDAVADEAIALLADRRPLSFTSDVIDDMRSLTVERVMDAWASHVQREWTTIIVGDAATVAPQLAAQGIAAEVIPAPHE